MAIKTKLAVVENTTLEIKGLSSSILVSSQIINDTTACCSEFKPPCLPLKVNTLYFPAANSTGTAHGNQPPCLLLPWQMRQPFVWWRTCSKKRKLFWQPGETRLESVTGFSLSNPASDLLVAHAPGRASSVHTISLIQHLPEGLAAVLLMQQTSTFILSRQRSSIHNRKQLFILFIPFTNKWLWYAVIFKTQFCLTRQLHLLSLHCTLRQIFETLCLSTIICKG